MFIICQDRKSVVNTDNIEFIEIGNPLEDDEGKFKIIANATSDTQYILGKYNTEEDAKEIFEEINNAIINNYKIPLEEEIMLDKILRKFGMEKLSNIKIKESFKKHPPRAEKMIEKWEYYCDNKEFSVPIVLDNDNYLVDGYTTYIYEKYVLNKKYMPVERI